MSTGVRRRDAHVWVTAEAGWGVVLGCGPPQGRGGSAPLTLDDGDYCVQLWPLAEKRAHACTRVLGLGNANTACSPTLTDALDMSCWV